jgi:hypothetical protein
MIDTQTYKMMHGDEDPTTSHATLADEEMRNNTILAKPFALFLPATVRSYGFHNKKWSM